MRNLLVTGGCGFIGSNFIHFLLTETDFEGRVINVDKLTYAGNPENLQGLAERFGERYLFRQVDICDREALSDLFAAHPIDGICHFAAESHVDRSIAFPDAFIQTNVQGTFNLLELVRSARNRLIRFHHVGTDEVYGSLGQKGYFTEQTAYDPSSPYSASKAASDHLVKAYHRTYDLPVSLSNCSNNYGPFQFPEKLIPLMVLNALEGKALPVYGDGLNVRDWLYVKDHCRAIWLIMNKGRVGQTYNVGGRCELPNLEVVRKICDRLDEIQPHPSIRSRRELIAFVKDRPGHDRRYAIDCSKLENELDWKPEETFDSGLQKTIAWYLQNRLWVSHVQSGAYRSWIASHYAM
jgi:dTDP-glucose 4,6-dehydratase